VSQAEVRKQHAQAENTKLGIEQAHHKKKIAAMERDHNRCAVGRLHNALVHHEREIGHDRLIARL